LNNAITSRSELPKVIAASSIGTLIEWYDFFIAGAAASSVWPLVFFPKNNPIAAVTLSISTFGLTYFTRPVAAFLFGHLGDRMGRRTTLVWTLIAMAVAMFGIAFTPAYSSIGVAAPILISVFRLVQGLGIGGEWQGGIVWATEFVSSKESRGFWASLVQLANSLGLSFGTLAFFLVRSVLPAQSFLSYGWRIPFLIGGLVVVVGFIIRYKMTESPLFKEIQRRGSREAVPSMSVWKTHWPKILLFAVITSYVIIVENLNLNPFGITYMTAEGIGSRFVFLAIAAGAAFSGVPLVLGAALSDKVGRRTPLLISTVLTAASVYPFYLMVNTLNPSLIVVATMLLFGVTYVGYGVLPIAFAEQFPTKFRYSGVGWSFQIGALISGVILVVVLPEVVQISHGPVNSWPYLVLVSLIITLAAMASSLTLKKPEKDEFATNASGGQ